MIVPHLPGLDLRQRGVWRSLGFNIFETQLIELIGSSEELMHGQEIAIFMSQFGTSKQGLVNVPIKHHPTIIWHIIFEYFQQIFEGDVQNPQKGTFTNPCKTHIASVGICGTTRHGGFVKRPKNSGFRLANNRGGTHNTTCSLVRDGQDYGLDIVQD